MRVRKVHTVERPLALLTLLISSLGILGAIVHAGYEIANIGHLGTARPVRWPATAWYRCSVTLMSLMPESETHQPK